MDTMMTLTHSTKIAIHVLVDDDSGSAATLILAVAMLVNLLIGLGRFVNELTLWAGVLIEAAHVTNTVFVIGFKALAFGMGVRV
jgi:hypothetical protein